LLQLSLAVHVAAIAATLARPGIWPWTLAAVIANHLLLMATGLWPRSSGLGFNRTRLPPQACARGEIAITIDDGPDPGVTPQVLALLAKHGAQATFFCIGEQIDRHPDLARAVVRAGHAIENHSQRHPLYFSLLGPQRQRNEIVQAQQTIATITGEVPRFFRAPAGLRSPLLDPILTRLNLQLVSWTRRGFDTVTTDADSVYARLARDLRGGDILLLHDGHAARTPSGTPIILEVLPRLLAAAAAAGLKPVTLRSALE
jgi:peptidoglycan/xylan/chitin deacetylase (PgdA/CDA1 family)